MLFLLAFSQQPLNEIFQVLLAAFGICQVLQAVILPIMFKMGVEKDRMVMMTVLLVPTLLIMMGNSFFSSVFNEKSLRLRPSSCWRWRYPYLLRCTSTGIRSFRQGCTR